MSDGIRPGGLTALAVLNFVFGGIGLLVFGMAAAGLAVMETGADVAMTQGELNGAEAADLAEAREVVSAVGVALWIPVGGNLLACALMIVSGVGYLGQKKGAGRMAGNIWSFIALLITAYSILSLGGAFGIGTLLWIAYPVVTLILINTTFKDDFVN